MEFHHKPIMLQECLTLLAPERGGVFADGTLGGGGHAEAVLRALPETGRLFSAFCGTPGHSFFMIFPEM